MTLNPELIARRRALPALLACYAVILLIAGAAAAYRPGINYATADPKADALKAFARGDSRFLALPDAVSAALAGDAVTPVGKHLDPDRDVRVIAPAANRPASPAQLAYVKTYNSMMATVTSHAGNGAPFVRPRPLSRFVFWLECLLMVAPFILHLYVLYRLGPYRTDGRLWATCLFEINRPLSPRTYKYREEIYPLLYLAWLTFGLAPFWALLLLFTIFAHTGPLR
jgi:hypothetical protein